MFTDDDDAVRTGTLGPSQRLADIAFGLLARETRELRQPGLSEHTARRGEVRVEFWERTFPGDLRAVTDELSDPCARSSIRSPR